MIIKRLLYTLACLLALPTAAESAEQELAAREHIRLEHEDGGDAYFFIVQAELGGPATLAAIELATGERVLLLATFDLKNGGASQRLDDLSSGWYAEFVVESGLQHIAEPGTVGGGSTSAWLEHVVELTSDPSYRETVDIQTADGGLASWLISGDDSAEDIQARKELAVQALGLQMQEAPPPLTTRRAVALVDTMISEHSGSMLDHFEDLIYVLGGAFEVAGLPTSTSQGEESQRPKSIRVPLSQSEATIKRMQRSLKEHVRSSKD